MALPMEFWGVEVKAGQPFKVNPGEGKILHLSQASLGEAKKGIDSVPLYVKFGNQKLVLGTLSSENFPQLSFDLVFEKEFELSHNWKNGSVYFCGYKSVVQEEDDFSDLEDDSEEEGLPMSLENGKVEAPAKPSTTTANASKPESAAKPKVKIVEPMKVEGEDSDDDEDDEDDDEDDESDEEGSDMESDSDEDEDDSDEDEETPKKAVQDKKRPVESAAKTPVSSKKAKVTTPQKTDGKKGGHTATPHPAKQAGKTPAGVDKKAQTPKSAGQVSCGSCSKTFNSDSALQAHSKAKHGAK